MIIDRRSKMWRTVLISTLIIGAQLALTIAFENRGSQENNLESTERNGKLLFPVLNVVKFANDVCAGTSRNGTCYTSQECTDKGGSETTTCAGGFGVCCEFVLDCGSSSSENNTYIISTASTIVQNCRYTICPSASVISRIRFDFNTHTIANPVSAATVGSGTATDTGRGGAGTCGTDQFVITGAQGAPSPVICGVNDGQHMILDSNGVDCHIASFMIATATTTPTRSWDIWVTQFREVDIINTIRAGPPGCLQYFTGSTGYVSSFNFPSIATLGASTTTSAATTHLNNQQYNICIRRETGMTQICYTPIGSAGTAAIAQSTFGLGLALAAASSDAVSGSQCIADYLGIPGGDVSATPQVVTAAGQSKFCGRALNTAVATGTTAHITICTIETPFRLNFFTDEFEASIGIATMEQLNETEGFPSGSLGFGLVYAQS